MNRASTSQEAVCRLLAPMAHVSALREMSTMFAVVIGVVFLREQLDLRRLAAVFCAMAGCAILRISR